MRLTRIRNRNTIIRLFDIDLNLLLTLSILLQTKSVSVTANRLGASQPTASRALARLRELFDDPLLIRTNHGMQMTRKAEELVEPLQNWLATTNALFVSHRFDATQLERRFRIAATDYGVETVMAPTLRLLHQRAPFASFDVVSYSDSMYAKLTSGELDLIVTGLDPDFSTLYGRHLFKDPFACILRADHPALDTAKGRLTVDEFLRWPHIGVRVGEQGFERIGTFLGDRAAERQFISTLPYFNTAPLLTGTSDAITTLSRRTAMRWAAFPGLTIIEPPVEFPPFDYWALYHERNRRDPAIQWMVELMAEACAADDA